MDFAYEHTREEGTNWLQFPRDTQLRKQLFFPEEVNAHPAKMNLHLLQSIIEFVAKEGDVLLDPFGGTGSLMIAALQYMRVILIELEEGYHKLQQQAKDRLTNEIPEAGALITLLHGDNRLMMPIPCNHIITSPPYAAMMSVSKGGTKRMRENADDSFSKMDRQMQEYVKSPRNIGKLNNFLYNQEMVKVYKRCFESIQPGGTLTNILKDRIEAQQRVSLTGWADKVCQKCGFVPLLRDEWKPPGIQFTAINKLHGLEVVENESILIYRRP